MKVFVYWNLHRGKWSIRALDGPMKGRVIARVGGVFLLDAVPKVSEAGRQRVIQERRKNVHAGVVGQLVESHAIDTPWLVSYNPYKGPSFYYKDEQGGDWEGSRAVYMGPNREVKVA